MSCPLHRAAIAYAERGWPVFPLEARGKRPLTTAGFRDASAEGDVVDAWWRRWPSANVGMVPGPAGFVVLDVDGLDGERSAQRLGLLSEPTLEVVTGRGRHRWYRHPGKGRIGNTPLGDGLDVRGDAGYVVLPPSIHPTGAVYRWRGKLADVIGLPPGVVGKLYQVMTFPATSGAVPAVIHLGRRNRDLTRAAGALRRQGWCEASILAALLGLNRAACRPPLGDDEVTRIAASIARYTPTPADPFAPLESPAGTLAGSWGRIR